jgi:hypothetical protein
MTNDSLYDVVSFGKISSLLFNKYVFIRSPIQCLIRNHKLIESFMKKMFSCDEISLEQYLKVESDYCSTLSSVQLNLNVWRRV